MTGHKSNLARATTESILNTLGDNDFVNVYKFSDTTEESVPCFKDMLVQVSCPNNIAIILIGYLRLIMKMFDG